MPPTKTPNKTPPSVRISSRLCCAHRLILSQDLSPYCQGKEETVNADTRDPALKTAEMRPLGVHIADHCIYVRKTFQDWHFTIGPSIDRGSFVDANSKRPLQRRPINTRTDKYTISDWRPFASVPRSKWSGTPQRRIGGNRNRQALEGEGQYITFNSYMPSDSDSKGTTSTVSLDISSEGSGCIGASGGDKVTEPRDVAAPVGCGSWPL